MLKYWKPYVVKQKLLRKLRLSADILGIIFVQAACVHHTAFFLHALLFTHFWYQGSWFFMGTNILTKLEEMCKKIFAFLFLLFGIDPVFGDNQEEEEKSHQTNNI